MASSITATVAQVRKAIINLLGLAAGLITLGFVHGQALVYVNMVIAVLTVIVHYQVPNAPVAAGAGPDEGPPPLSPI